MDRRQLIAAAAGAFAASVAQQAKAYSGTVEQHITDPKFLKTHAVRFIELDTESAMDFNGQFTRYLKEYQGDDGYPDRTEFLRANGYPLGPVDMSYEDAHKIMMQYPAYAAYVRLSRATHEHMWATALASINKHADMYMSAMEATDKMGPGHLELNPGIFIPEYAKYEIHEQPGGYVGSAFAGLLYHYSMVTAFYHGLAEGPVLQDQRNQLMVAGWATPPDGKLKRILEVGCSHGSTTISLRERFDNPDVEVWALDIGGPQVRYAHHRAVSLGHNINFVQRLAEDTKFPDNHFDMIAINLLFHEVPSSAAKKIIAELNRITRPGGVWVGDASNQGGPRPATISAKARTWASHRFNYEVWAIQNNANDFPAIRKDTGWRTDMSTGKPIAIKA